MKRFPPFPAPAVMIIAVAMTSGSARAESLADAVAYAYETNPGLQSQRAALRGLDENYVQARSGYGLSASASESETSYNFHLSGRTGGTATAGTNSEGLSIVQPVWTGGRVAARLSQAEAGILSGREQVRRYELDLLQRVVTAYISVRRDLELVGINRDTVTVLKSQLSDAEAKAAVREVTLTDVAQSRARWAQALTGLASAQQALGASRAQFLAVVGQNPGELDAPPPVDGLPATPEQAFEAAEGNSPQLLAARYSEQGTRASIAAAKAQAMPSISARGDLQRAPYQPYLSTPFSTTVVGSLTVTVPLLTGGQIGSGIRQAREENNRDRLAIDDARLQVLQNVAIAWEQLSALRKQLATLEIEVQADEFAFYGVRQEEKLALRSTIEVLNAELELTNAQQNLVRSRAGEYISRIQLLAAEGVLTPQLLSSNVRLYDPSENFDRVKNKGSILPLELPVRALDALASPRIERPSPAATPSVMPNKTGDGEPLPPTPKPETPLVSILVGMGDTSPPLPLTEALPESSQPSSAGARATDSLPATGGAGR